MILDYSKEAAKILDALHLEVTPNQSLQIAIVLAEVFDKGVSFERARIIEIIQRFGMNPMPLVERIRKPIR